MIFIKEMVRDLTKGFKKGALIFSALLLLSFVALLLSEPEKMPYEFSLGSVLFLITGLKLSDKSNAMLMILVCAALILKLAVINVEING
ncbi:hypothetical protein GCM10008090_27600 [Arenicella chitinivorans]|uniref:Uncharacterized protein n=1 Tax=Arenicella chitinivorans TaxID=1329800 RepID=A0A918VRG2_9GAMM|nr:hypothetical protein [Arenicella chitinivorans]GHA16276.1 hypothetical protein GCM10008090_27600 [Arenicella chitinivorans]